MVSIVRAGFYKLLYLCRGNFEFATLETSPQARHWLIRVVN